VDDTGGEAIDLDTGTTGRTPSPLPRYDLLAERTGLLAVNGAGIAARPGATNAGPGDCAGADWGKAVDAAGLSLGAVFCVRTNGGRIGVITVQDVEFVVELGRRLAQIAVSYTIWS
jgi:hypothetical protein